MKIMTLDTLIKALKEKESAVIYGISEGDTIILSSLTKTKGLKRMGIFRKDKKQLIKTSKSEKLTFYLKDRDLFCFVNPSDRDPIEMCVSDTLNYSTDFNLRNHGIIDESVLQEKIVTIIGLGSIGSSIACDLERSSVTNLNLIEFDTVSISNICRSNYDLFDIGKKKTEAILPKLLRINPCITAKLYAEDVLEMDTSLLNTIIESSDLIIDATDSIKTKILINGLAHHTKPVVYPSVYDYGKGGDILFTMPGLPCFECVFSSIMDQMKKVKRGDWDYTTGTVKPMPALFSDIQVIVARTVKLALAILTGDQENSFIEKITEPGCSLLFIGNEKGEFIFDKPFQEIWAETEINDECTCQTLA